MLFKLSPIQLLFALLMIFPYQVTAEEPAPDPNLGFRKMVNRVDELLDERLQELGWQPTGECDDASFIRRASLDLTGNLPTATEVIEFLQSKKANKRAELVKRLLSAPQSANHLGTTWAKWLLPENAGPINQAGQNGLQAWLRNRFAENLRYDRLVSDLLVSSGPIENGPTSFFVSLETKPEKIAAKTARVFMGLQLDCAECHNHPFDKWTQKDFWGFAAYFARLSTNREQQEFILPGTELTEKDEGEVKLPGSDEVVPPNPLVTTGLSGLEVGTRRQQLTLWLTARENPFLARAAVNRCWSLMFGRGLIEPIDDMRSMEAASHPKLLRELSEYFAASGYNLRGLIELLANTRAYSRGTKHIAGEPPEASYASMAVKPLTEEQLSTAVLQVARTLNLQGGAEAQRALMTQLGKLRGEASQASLGIVQALVTLHGETFDGISREETSRLLIALGAPHLDDRQRVRWLFLSTLNREPSEAEQAALSPTLNSDLNPESKDGKAVDWQSDLLWALINSTEFAMTP